jgi:hypothetical protein
LKDVGSAATPEVIETWGEVYELFKGFSGERRERLQQVADQLGLSYKVARRRLRNYEAMNNLKPETTAPLRQKAASPRGDSARRAGGAATGIAVEGGEFADRTLTCVDCGEEFPFSAREQAFFAEKGFQPPKRCKSCKQVRKAAG